MIHHQDVQNGMWIRPIDWDSDLPSLYVIEVRDDCFVCRDGDGNEGAYGKQNYVWLLGSEPAAHKARTVAKNETVQVQDQNSENLVWIVSLQVQVLLIAACAFFDTWFPWLDLVKGWALSVWERMGI